jgi:hypothetical protein
MSQAEIDVLAERQRQIYAEEFDEAHDDLWTGGELASAAVCYALSPVERKIDLGPKGDLRSWLWPWDEEWWNPKRKRRRDLVRAAALLIAEIDRLDHEAAQ